jgi:hypothetical protein
MQRNVMPAEGFQNSLQITNHNEMGILADPENIDPISEFWQH